MTDDEPLGRPYLRAAPHVDLPEAPPVEQVEIRPYLLTGGRTDVDDPTIALETIVVATPPRPGAVPRPRPSAEETEKHAIVVLCGSPLSVAEVAAHRRVPLGVARVLVADLVAENLLIASTVTAQADDVAFLERLIAGVSAL